MASKREISIIAAMDLHGVIGCNNTMPWHLPNDLKRFAKITKGHPVIMGRKTYESIIQSNKEPLANRTNIIITSQHNYRAPGCIVASSIDGALSMACSSAGSEEVFIIGGASIYKEAIQIATKMYITHVIAEVNGDIFFPKWDMDDWVKITQEIALKDSWNKFTSIFCVYKKRKKEMVNYINLNHSRTNRQKEIMMRIQKDGVCPFCIDNLSKYHTEKILKSGKWWILTKNFEPYNGTRVHLLFIYKYHAVSLGDIAINAFNELLEFASWAEKHFKISGGAIFMRFGDTDRTGGTVEHLHAQLIEGDSSRENGKKLKVSLGYRSK